MIFCFAYFSVNNILTLITLNNKKDADFKIVHKILNILKTFIECNFIEHEFDGKLQCEWNNENHTTYLRHTYFKRKV